MKTEQKVTSSHLERDAWLYVRQSTLRQVMENTESTERQYALRERAVALGWPIERIHVIDEDLGESGASQKREGFRKLTAEVANGSVGVVMGLEVSRLARNSVDWHRLLEICVISNTLILDEDAIYNPAEFNDQLILGIKGTMSVAEMHYLKSRMRGGVLNKAARGELKMALPIGFVYDPLDRVVIDPDVQIQETIHCLFDTFRRTGSACATVRYFRKENILFPARGCGAPQKGEIFWHDLTHKRALTVLRNPRYTGAFVYGRTTSRVGIDGQRIHINLPQDEWQFLIRDAHPGYIDWDRYEANLAQLRSNAQAFGADRRTPPREGSALIQGIVLCGHCGRKMTVHYHHRNGRQLPTYMCQSEGFETAVEMCQRVPGVGIDQIVGELLVELMVPASLEMTLTVQDELLRRADEADTLRARKVQRASEAVELARQRYMQTHPNNRMVADQLEADWNNALRAHQEAQREYEKQRELDGDQLSEQRRQEILTLASDFARLWHDCETPGRERKRMVRLLIEDVTVFGKHDDTTITLGIRLSGGATRTLKIKRELPAAEKYRTAKTVVTEIDALLDHHTDAEIAEILNQRGLRTGYDLSFNTTRVFGIRLRYQLKSRYQRLREQGLLSVQETAKALGISPSTVRRMRWAGKICSYPYNAKDARLYELPATTETNESHSSTQESIQ